MRNKKNFNFYIYISMSCLLVLHYLAFFVGKKIDYHFSYSMLNFKASLDVLLIYFESLAKEFPTGFFTILSGFLLFNVGTVRLENQKQLSNFREKYIKLKNEIDKNKKDILISKGNCSQELDTFSNIFIQYTNLLYEEMISVENKLIKDQIDLKWINSFEKEILDWKKLFSIKFGECEYNSNSDAASENIYDKLFAIFKESNKNVKITDYFQKIREDKLSQQGKMLDAHNTLQMHFRESYIRFIEAEEVSAKLKILQNKTAS